MQATFYQPDFLPGPLSISSWASKVRVFCTAAGTMFVGDSEGLSTIWIAALLFLWSHFGYQVEDCTTFRDLAFLLALLQTFWIESIHQIDQAELCMRLIGSPGTRPTCAHPAAECLEERASVTMSFNALKAGMTPSSPCCKANWRLNDDHCNDILACGC